ncbi:archaemetzincin [Desulfospira joergensenii]|uniref:archaemetzincin n=1 Tax=Desulfospira joergensenii TaxID=53329 RepID=UPI0003B77C9F|nr:archaemetzincin [Desulfospira joergensenii]
MTAPALILSPIGDIFPWVNQTLAAGLPDVFGFPTRVVPLMEDLGFAHDPERNQFHSTEVLKVLAQRCPDDGLKILGITREDLFIPILTHVYGEAQLGGRACIVSISRLISGPDMGGRDAGAGRILKEAIHELGHCFNLRHCEDARCIMHYCRKLEDVDNKSEKFCRYCRILMEDEIQALGQDPDGLT